MAGRGKTRGGGARTAAIALSVVFHLVLLALLVRYAARTTPAQLEPPTIQAMLFPSARQDVGRRARLRAASRGDHDAVDRTRRKALLARALPLGEVAPFAPGAALPPAEAGAGTGVAAGPAPALRGLGGCGRPDLSRREREDCEARRWADAAPSSTAQANPRLNLDLTGRYAKNPEPFLSRRPSKGCRARLTGETDVRDDDQNYRAGITCVKPF